MLVNYFKMKQQQHDIKGKDNTEKFDCQMKR